ncbi:hypothetical protein [Anaerocolumna chitinilytica]|uniref:Uncharacterized protein n=1 Tax=Anaerocolumna chitinilytica TaxID=1727145 RepID=A0A7M3S9Z8_9FIRM|nr:hypothetical protein [Anaerocolumna chitinilytica]BCK01416.1 hypothetical protein bsdcttw_44560 [Anaerocolumna chitinilytica]
MKVRALEQFNDLTENVMRKKGDIFTTTEKRFEEINSTSFGVLVEHIETEETEQPPKRRQRNSSDKAVN